MVHLSISRSSEVQRVILGWQTVSLDDASLLLVVLVVEGTGLEAVGVLCVE